MADFLVGLMRAFLGSLRFFSFGCDTAGLLSSGLRMAGFSSRFSFACGRIFF